MVVVCLGLAWAGDAFGVDTTGFDGGGSSPLNVQVNNTPTPVATPPSSAPSSSGSSSSTSSTSSSSPSSSSSTPSTSTNTAPARVYGPVYTGPTPEQIAAEIARQRWLAKVAQHKKFLETLKPASTSYNLSLSPSFLTRRSGSPLAENPPGFSATPYIPDGMNNDTVIKGAKTNWDEWSGKLKQAELDAANAQKIIDDPSSSPTAKAAARYALSLAKSKVQSIKNVVLADNRIIADRVEYLNKVAGLTQLAPPASPALTNQSINKVAKTDSSMTGADVTASDPGVVDARNTNTTPVDANQVKGPFGPSLSSGNTPSLNADPSIKDAMTGTPSANTPGSTPSSPSVGTSLFGNPAAKPDLPGETAAIPPGQRGSQLQNMPATIPNAAGQPNSPATNAPNKPSPDTASGSPTTNNNPPAPGSDLKDAVAATPSEQKTTTGVFGSKDASPDAGDLAKVAPVKDGTKLSSKAGEQIVTAAAIAKDPNGNLTNLFDRGGINSAGSLSVPTVQAAPELDPSTFPKAVRENPNMQKALTQLSGLKTDATRLDAEVQQLSTQMATAKTPQKMAEIQQQLTQKNQEKQEKYVAIVKAEDKVKEVHKTLLVEEDPAPDATSAAQAPAKTTNYSPDKLPEPPSPGQAGPPPTDPKQAPPPTTN